MPPRTSNTAPAMLLGEARRKTLSAAVLAALPSAHSRRAYARALEDLFAFAAGQPVTLALLHDWRLAMSTKKLASSTISLRIAALRAFVREGRRTGAIDGTVAQDLLEIKGLPYRGTRTGTWLTLEQLQRLLIVPNLGHIRGRRNLCLLAILAGCALREDELVRLEVSHFQKLDGRWVIADLQGKGGRVRTVAVPAFVKAAIDGWLRASSISSGRVIRQLTLAPQGLSTAAVRDIVRKTGEKIGIGRLSPHDLRRTCARLCRQHGGQLEQIQAMLGHADIRTTQRYLGTVQDLRNAPNDNMGL